MPQIKVCLAATAGLLLSACVANSPATQPLSCPPIAGWFAPAAGNPVSQAAVIAQAGQADVVLLGETHDAADHHLWQLQVLSALQARKRPLVIGFESFPRAAQPVLDAWIAGQLSEAAFLADSRWHEVWRFDAALYMPLFRFARMNSVPMVAINVEQSLISAVSKDGWDAVPADKREGVGSPLPASPAYRQRLREVFRQHLREGQKFDDARFDSFVQAQTVWDRAMAEALTKAAGRPGRPLVAGIVGRGHVSYDGAITAQLRGLGIDKAVTLMAWEKDAPCDELRTAEGAIADFVFGLAAWPQEPKPAKPRLGVLITMKEGAVTVSAVTADSVAEKAGIKKGDRITHAAGQALAAVQDLVAVVTESRFGTWLPIRIVRDRIPQDIVARFPARPKGAE